MNCDQFRRQMDLMLDRRENPVDDRALNHHAECCSDCRSALSAWRSIDRYIEASAALHSISRSGPVDLSTRPSVAVATSNRRIMQVRWTAGAAVAMLIGVVVAAQALNRTRVAKRDSESGVRQLNGSEFQSASPLQSVRADDPSGSDNNPSDIETPDIETTDWVSRQWWDSMADEPWVSQTLPAVNSVRIGVAPIGRSMKQAFAILMIRTGQSKMAPAGLESPSPPETHREQTSSMERVFDWESYS